jgi:hypothetical protein
MAAAIEEWITAHDYEKARALLRVADTKDPRLSMEKGRLALYEHDCDGAVAILGRADVAALEEGAMLFEIAQGCARVTAAVALVRDEAAGVELRFQDDGDVALGSLLTDTVLRARQALTRDLGATWPLPTRITVVRDLLSLAAMTGLPYESARTTGTVAVAKWGRVTLLSPRASPRGYAWRDTVTHELTHLAISRATVDRAPLWLQEGLAKRQEVRWRAPGPFDDRPSADSLAKRGMELGLDLPLDRLGPSIAMLPSADAAMVAFAEVTSFVGFLAQKESADVLPRLLGELRTGKSVDDALRAAASVSLKEWDIRWRADLRARTVPPVPVSFGLGVRPPDTREHRERTRLAELLLGRQKTAASRAELARLKKPVEDDPALRVLRARLAHREENMQAMSTALGTPTDVAAPYAPWWSLRGTAARALGDGSGAAFAFEEARSYDPLDVEAACEVVVGVGSSAAGSAASALCQAALDRSLPGPGQD